MLNKVVSLNGTWDVVFDPTNEGQKKKYFKNFPKNGKPIPVPGVWEQVKPGYDGVGWYRTTFQIPREWKGKIVRLKFGAVNYFAEAWVNGKSVGTHEGGYTPFIFPIHPKIKIGTNELVVRVIDPPRDRKVEGFQSGAPLLQSDIPTWKAGWYHNFGGIWQTVELLVTERTYIEDVFVNGSMLDKKVTMAITVVNRGARRRSALVVRVVAAKDKETVLFTLIKKVRFPRGRRTFTFSRKVRGFTAWDCDNPFLYTLQAEIKDQREITATVAARFGMRDFHVEDGHFYLNGKRIALKGFLQQGVYPKTLVFPHDEKMARKEMMLLKNNGFNYVRAHLKPSLPITLDLADELGILISGEPPLGWIIATPAAAVRCRNEVQELVMRDRNRACVVFWCLFNEINDDVTYGLKRWTLMKLVRRLDPSRLVIGNSGSFTSHGGHTDCLHPYSFKKRPLIDCHAYYGATQDGLKRFRTSGKRGVPAYISEFGAIEAPMDYEKFMAGYTPAERKLGIEDYAQYKSYFDSLKEIYRRAQLNKLYPTIRQYLRAINDHKEEDLRLEVSHIRSNPLWDGYAYCQLADASGEIFGATDLWRDPKPMFHGMVAATRTPLPNVCITPRLLSKGEKCAIDLWLVNEHLQGKPYTITTSVKNAAGRSVVTFKKSVKGRNWIDYLGSKSVKADWAPGTYLAESVLTGPGVTKTVNTMRCTVLPDVKKTVNTVALFDMAKNLEGPFKQLGYQTLRGGNNFRRKDLVNIFSMNQQSHPGVLVEVLGMIKNIVNLGGVVIMLEPVLSTLYDFFLPRAVRRVSPMRSNLYLHAHPIFAGLPQACVAGYEYEGLQPRSYNNPDDILKLGGKIIAGTVSSHMWTRPDVYRWGSCLDVIPMGRGQIITCQMNLLGNVGKSKVAETLLVNLVNYAATQIKPGHDEKLWSGRCIDEVKI